MTRWRIGTKREPPPSPQNSRCPLCWPRPRTTLRLCSFLLRMHSWRTTPEIIVMKNSCDCAKRIQLPLILLQSITWSQSRRRLGLWPCQWLEVLDRVCVCGGVEVCVSVCVLVTLHPNTSSDVGLAVVSKCSHHPLLPDLQLLMMVPGILWRISPILRSSRETSAFSHTAPLDNFRRFSRVQTHVSSSSYRFS